MATYRFRRIPWAKQSAFSQGWECCRRGDDISENPYPVTDWKHAEFRLGYRKFKDTMFRDLMEKLERQEAAERAARKGKRR